MFMLYDGPYHSTIMYTYVYVCLCNNASYSDVIGISLSLSPSLSLSLSLSLPLSESIYLSMHIYIYIFMALAKITDIVRVKLAHTPLSPLTTMKEHKIITWIIITNTYTYVADSLFFFVYDALYHIMHTFVSVSLFMLTV